MPPLHNYEPSREIKQLFLKTRKADPALGGTPNPGLFQTVRASDAFGLALALLLEIYGLANLLHVGSTALPAALALVAVLMRRICSRRRWPRTTIRRSVRSHRKQRVRGA